MAMKLIEANYNRHEFEKDTFQDAIIYTLTFNAGGVARKITNAALTSFGVDAIAAVTTTQITFDTLVGNLPWSSYSKFASPSAPAGGQFQGLPTASLPKAGAITITEGFATEVMYYGSITWTSATAGTFNNVKRAAASGGTSYIFTGAATGTFTNVIPVREKLTIWNRTGSNIYLGDSAAIATTPVNAVILGGTTLAVPAGGIWSVWLEPLQEIWIMTAVGGLVNIAEYR